MTEQITVPKQTWDAMLEALEIAEKHLAYVEIFEALTAANAVSEAQPAGPEDMAIYKSIADGYLTKVQPVDEWTIRGTLAAKLKCWHRLKEDEASELVRLFAANAVSHPKTETTPSPEGGAITSESAADAVSHPQATEPAVKKLIGWRTADYLRETDDPKMAKNWEVHYEILPIFEGDANTKLAAAPEAL